MPRDRDLLIKRNKAIHAAFKKLTALNKYKYEFILATVGEPFFLKPASVQRIILNPPDYFPPRKPKAPKKAPRKKR